MVAGLAPGPPQDYFATLLRKRPATFQWSLESFVLQLFLSSYCRLLRVFWLLESMYPRYLRGDHSSSPLSIISPMLLTVTTPTLPKVSFLTARHLSQSKCARHYLIHHCCNASIQVASKSKMTSKELSHLIIDSAESAVHPPLDSGNYPECPSPLPDAYHLSCHFATGAGIPKSIGSFQSKQV